jgi:Transposase, Mutator family
MFAETRHQRDWVHKTANVLDALPKSVQPQARRALAETSNAQNKPKAELAADRFASEFGVKGPTAADKILSDREVLLVFYDFPAEHWGHLRTSNPIESTFATVRARTNVTRGAGSREAGLAMAFKLLQAAEGVEKGQRPQARCTRPSGGAVRERQADGEKRGRGRRVIARSRSTTLDYCFQDGGDQDQQRRRRAERAWTRQEFAVRHWHSPRFKIR